jgi:monofunctional biosynthetic peptidoglycan transglycosylase
MQNRSKGIVLAAIASLLIVVILGLIVSCPDVSDLKTKNPTTTRLMTYRESQYQREGIRVTKRQRWVSLSLISPDLIRAVLISEDDKFYDHEGFDWVGIREALGKNWQQRRIVMGGSTITQQLAKNLYLKPTRNPIRKIQEAWIASRLEKTLSKRRILEIYLNVIEWGGGVYGAEAASQLYYNKPASELTLAQAIRLASVLPNPIRYSPLSDSSKRMLKKRRTIALRMLQKHVITEDEYQLLLGELEGHPVSAPVETTLSSPDSSVVADSLPVQIIADTSTLPGR